MNEWQTMNHFDETRINEDILVREKYGDPRIARLTNKGIGKAVSDGVCVYDPRSKHGEMRVTPFLWMDIPVFDWNTL